MILLKKGLLIIALTLVAGLAHAQNTDVNGIIKEGIRLNGEKNYAAAIEKYKEALASEPDNAQANYQLAFSLNASGKGTEAIPYLNKVIKTGGDLTGPAYELTGSIYDASHQPQQAIEAYQQGIKLKPDYQPLYFNLGIAYFPAQKYAEAELASIEAIKLDPKHANSQRLYGLVTFHQNKRVPALMGLCSFLLLDPEGPRADEAYTNLQSLLKGGDLKAAKADPETLLLNKTLSTAVAASGGQLETQLKTIFTAVGKLGEKTGKQSFFWNYYAAFFYKLSQTPHFSTAVKLISLSADKAGAAAWLQSNTDKRKALDDWAASAERKF
ncbi:tetratricopeptide repeat protein [Mucilaginibacter sp. SMC90]|uniref:tetratricopeptide repeat protein n=1 Tax=Mucilaginibacter sp. SMC90 TaxID=2929803 RepID=UPI001FB339E4|nr:tetratricopeptide repeat protein [Mucilaginibacter sp. SMC90]UOE49580.1 tetratricopeptide repeat protein [Mucilaginibacter sp. SMC90]